MRNATDEQGRRLYYGEECQCGCFVHCSVELQRRFFLVNDRPLTDPEWGYLKKEANLWQCVNCKGVCLVQK